MSSKAQLALRLLIEHPDGLYGSELVEHSAGKISFGSAYTLLERLVEKGYVREEPKPLASTPKISRIRHVITPSGRHAYAALSG